MDQIALVCQHSMSEGRKKKHQGRAQNWRIMMMIAPEYPLVNIQKAMENGHRKSGFSHEKW